MKKAKLRDLRDKNLGQRVRLSVDKDGMAATLTGDLDDVGFRRWKFDGSGNVVYSITVNGTTIFHLGPEHEIDLL